MPDEPRQVSAEMQRLRAMLARVEQLIAEGERTPVYEEDIFG
jgi:hypothetical protein